MFNFVWISFIPTTERSEVVLFLNLHFKFVRNIGYLVNWRKNTQKFQWLISLEITLYNDIFGCRNHLPKPQITLIKDRNFCLIKTLSRNNTQIFQFTCKWSVPLFTWLCRSSLIFRIFEQKLQEAKLRHRCRSIESYFGFCHQGAELFSAEGENVYLPFSGVFKVVRGSMSGLLTLAWCSVVVSAGTTPLALVRGNLLPCCQHWYLKRIWLISPVIMLERKMWLDFAFHPVRCPKEGEFSKKRFSTWVYHTFAGDEPRSHHPRSH